MPFDPTTLARYPDQPGVYLMKNDAGAVLYVGKAKNLRVRLRQYFAENGDARPMIPTLIAQIATIDTIVALTETDALLLENNLIKRHQPKYNVLLKDDKTFISLVLTKHAWPMLQLVRYKGKPKSDGVYFGPYTNALAARHIHDLLLRLFPLRQCSDAEFASRTRPCLLYDIKRCLAPCVGKCTPTEYQTLVDGASRMLKGQDKELLAELKRQMEMASEALEFERADALLQTIRQIEHVTKVQHVDNPYAKDADVVGLYREADAVLIALLQLREGKLIGSEHFSFHQIASEDTEILESFLVQHYRGKAALPKEILVQAELPQGVEEVLGVHIHAPQRGKKAELIEMALRNARALFVREQDARSLREKQLLDLQETLGLTRYPRRIECFDTSNIGGSDPVASLVAFVHGERDKGSKRLFKIRGAPDDPSAMRETLRRHLTKAKEKGTLPDLVIVDGGKGQLGVALDVFAELDIASVDVIGVAKEEARHDKGLTREKVYVPHQSEPIVVDPRSPLLFLLQRIRDEAHRAALQFHRKKRSERVVKSELDELRGIGPTKKRRLLQRFGSVRAMREASDEQLRSVEGITNRDLETLVKFLRRP